MRETTRYTLQARGVALSVLLVMTAFVFAACGDYNQDGASTGASPPPNASAKRLAPTSIRLANDGETLIGPSGRRFSITANAVVGYVDAAVSNGEYVDVNGWAAPAEFTKPAEVVVAVVGNRSVAVARPSVERPDLVDGYDQPGLRNAGFGMSIPRASLKCAAPNQGLKTYGLAGSAASPLKWLGDVPDAIAGAC